jgi:predicted CXXCH cytochrome family protein
MAGRTYNDQPLGHEQYNQWRSGIHGQALLEKGDLSAPTCNDCHGNHGALPPGVGSVANACGTCHGKIAKLFADTRMRHAFERVGLPGCATCHGAHHTIQPSDEMLGMGDQTVCVQCHNPDNPQYGATLAGGETARQLRQRLELLKADIAQAEQTIQQAERLGMEVRGPRFDLREAFDALTNARTMIHTFQPQPVDELLDAGLNVTTQVNGAAQSALNEHTYRRLWLAGSLLPILVVIGLLLLYIRSLPVPSQIEVK